MEPPKKGETTVAPSSATVAKPDAPSMLQKKDSSRKGGGGPNNSAAFDSLPPRIAPVPPLEICWKCVRCYGAKLKPLPFKKACLILAVVLIAEGLLRLVHNLIQALVDFHDKVRSENTVLVGSGMYGIPSLFIREALLEPFYTVIGAGAEFEASNKPRAKVASHRFVFYAAALEKILCDLAPGVGLLLLVLSVVKGQQAGLVSLIISGLIGFSAIFTLIQFPVSFVLAFSVTTSEAYQQRFCQKLECGDALFPFYLVMASPLTVLLLALKIHSFKCVFALFKSLKASSSIRPAGAMMPSLGPAAVQPAAMIMPPPEESKATVAFESEKEGGAKKKEKGKAKASPDGMEPEATKEDTKTEAAEMEGEEDGEKTKKKGTKKSKKTKKEKRGSKSTKKKKGKKKKSAE